VNTTGHMPAVLLACTMAIGVGGPAFAQARVGIQTQQSLNAQTSADQMLFQLNAQVNATNAADAAIRASLTPQQFEMLSSVRRSLRANPSSPEALAAWEGFVRAGGASSLDPLALVQWALRDSYVQQSEELRNRADRVKFFNDQKQAIRDEIERIQLHQCRGEDCPPFQTNARALSTSFGSAFLTSRSQLSAYAAELELQLRTVDEDSQLANIDLQELVQRMQQNLQAISNIAKAMNDSAMAIIRNFKG